MKKKIALIGYGQIGRGVEKRAHEKGWTIPIILRTSGVYNFRQEKIAESANWLGYFSRKEIDVAVICISTLDDGTIAYYYINRLLENGISVVTSEKGAWGNYGPELKPYINRIGYSAVVGGGTRMLPWIRNRISSNTETMHFVLNGTLNHIFDGLSRGKTLNEVIIEVQKLGYAEPGAKKPLDIINVEAGKDVPLKVASLINICGLGEIRAKEIKVHNIDEKNLRRLIREASLRRYIVSITKEEDEEEDIIGGFRFKTNDWYVSGGFKNRNHNPLFLQLVPPGVNNASLIHGIDGTYILTGPGAGVTPTVLGGIMKDVESFLKI
ncbi:hypothetical protein KKA72_00065 [Patescibacteria group bacterium]|nr:hypothetical protein [Patescibacteria group bacterium]